MNGTSRYGHPLPLSRKRRRSGRWEARRSRAPNDTRARGRTAAAPALRGQVAELRDARYCVSRSAHFCASATSSRLSGCSPSSPGAARRRAAGAAGAAAEPPSPPPSAPPRKPCSWPSSSVERAGVSTAPRSSCAWLRSVELDEVDADVARSSTCSACRRSSASVSSAQRSWSSLPLQTSTLSVLDRVLDLLALSRASAARESAARSEARASAPARGPCRRRRAAA